MENAKIEPGIFLTNDYLLHIRSKNTVAIADIHLGYEFSLLQKGITVPKIQKQIVRRRLTRILEKYRPDILVINGDFKHEFSMNLRQEWREVTELLDFLSGNCNVVLVRGNHDNYLKTIVSRFGKEVEFVEDYRVDDILFVHGHREIADENFRLLVLAHEHPSIKLVDDVGVVIRLPCFLHDKKRKFVVLPAFSPLASGTDIISSARQTLLSPFLRTNGIGDCRVYAVTAAGLLDFNKVCYLRQQH